MAFLLVALFDSLLQEPTPRGDYSDDWVDKFKPKRQRPNVLPPTLNTRPRAMTPGLSYIHAQVPDGWVKCFHPHWNELPYFKHSKYPVVTTLDISISTDVRNPRDPGKLKAELALQLFASHLSTSDDDEKMSADTAQSLLPAEWEVLVTGAAPVAPLRERGNTPTEQPGSPDSQRKRQYNVVFIDHKHHLASSNREDIEAYASKVNSSGKEVRKDSNTYLMESRYWSYISRHPIYFFDKPEKLDIATQKATRAADTLESVKLTRRRQSTLFGELLPLTLSHDRCIKLVAEIGDYKDLEKQELLDNGRRTVAVATFLADYYRYCATNPPV